MKTCKLGLLFLSFFLMSCSKLIYLDNMIPERDYITPSLELKIHKGDKLSILVNSKNPEIAAPFNIYSAISYQVTGNGEVSTKQNFNSSSTENGYLVNEQGMIDFPFLGRIAVVDLTCEELSRLIEKRLIAEQYIDDPIVDVNLSNLKVTVMGEVQKNGVIPLNHSGMNLLEAITLSGGTTQNAALDKVCVIRREDGSLKMYKTDIRSTELFQSPCFALQQNDMIYIYPRSAKVTSSEERGWRILSIGTGITSLIISLLAFLK